MAVELLLPGRRISTPKPPSYLALNMAFGVGNPAILGDKSRYRSHGTIVGAVPAAGVHGLCLDFNNALPSYVTIPAAHTQLNFTTQDFSIITRFNADTLVGNLEIFDRGRANVDGYLLDIDANGRPRFLTCQAAAIQYTYGANGDIVAGTWYTFGVSRTGASVRIYRNGVDITAVPGVHINPATCNRNATIGIRDDLATWPFDGKMEFVRVFRNIALPTSSHLAWHNALV